MKKAKKKIKVRDMKPKKNVKGGGLHGQKYIQGANRTSLR